MRTIIRLLTLSAASPAIAAHNVRQAHMDFAGDFCYSDFDHNGLSTTVSGPIDDGVLSTAMALL
jgi:hypothetical protein